MNATGFVRKIDDLGRVCLPMEWRRSLDLNASSYVAMYTDADSLILKKHEIACFLCGNKDDLLEIEGKRICPKCVDKIAALHK